MRCPIETGEGQRLLDRARPASLEHHIRDCPVCGEFTAAQASVAKALDLWDAPAVSADFDRRLYRRIELDVRWWEFLLRPLSAPVTARGGVVAAVALVLLAAGLWIERPGAFPAPPPQSATIEALAPDQAEHALQDMETMQEFGRLLPADPVEPRM
jgi:hypothetical protein